MKRANLQELTSNVLDVLVVGGGIVGCGIARDAALRGLQVGLIEREDIGGGTTSRSTRLIHGGLRYLEMLDFSLVRQDMREREILIRIAPHLVKPMPFLVPMYGWSAWQRDRLRVGMVLYDVLSYDKSLPRHSFLNRHQTLAAEPYLNPRGLQGAARYYDAQVELPERLALANAIDAAEHGALIRTYTDVIRFLREEPNGQTQTGRGRVVGVEARDIATDRRVQIRANVVVNATGPWLDRNFAEQAGDSISTNGHADASPPPLLRTTKGVHLVMPKTTTNAILSIAASDGRVFFVVPWYGYSLVGTTDTDFEGDPADAHADRSDVAYLLREAAAIFPVLRDAPVYYGMAGVRALVRKEGVKEGAVSRKHAIRDHGKLGGPDGLVSVLGGKITAYRGIAEEATDLVMERLGRHSARHTAYSMLPGGDAHSDDVWKTLKPRAEGMGLTDEQIQHLIDLYGSRARDVLVLAERRPQLATPFCEHAPTLKAQATYAALNEGVETLADVLLRRAPVGLASCMALDCVDAAAEVVGQTMRWDEERRRHEAAEYRRLVAERYSAPLAESVPA
ncbi:MAG: glycerol-3-phosphate dehydrogenase/oxidase [Chloroflexi bacterium]|nr:glycerol-3-phosphate dehydrogenase/oxidase [Chloroflexota bacterium]